MFQKQEFFSCSQGHCSVGLGDALQWLHRPWAGQEAAGGAGLDRSLSCPWPPPGTDLLLDLLRPELQLLGVWFLQVSGIVFIPQLCLLHCAEPCYNKQFSLGWEMVPEIWSSSQQHGAGTKAPWSKRAKCFVGLKAFKSPGKHHLSAPSFAVAEVPGPPKEAKIVLRALTGQGPHCQHTHSKSSCRLPSPALLTRIPSWERWQEHILANRVLRWMHTASGFKERGSWGSPTGIQHWYGPPSMPRPSVTELWGRSTCCGWQRHVMRTHQL